MGMYEALEEKTYMWEYRFAGVSCVLRYMAVRTIFLPVLSVLEIHDESWASDIVATAL